MIPMETEHRGLPCPTSTQGSCCSGVWEEHRRRARVQRSSLHGAKRKEAPNSKGKERQAVRTGGVLAETRFFQDKGSLSTRDESVLRKHQKISGHMVIVTPG